jgi:hypothetical protein
MCSGVTDCCILENVSAYALTALTVHPLRIAAVAPVAAALPAGGEQSKKTAPSRGTQQASTQAASERERS